MADVVGRREADRQVVRDMISAKVFLLYQRFGKIEGEFVPCRAEGQANKEG